MTRLLLLTTTAFLAACTTAHTTPVETAPATPTQAAPAAPAEDSAELAAFFESYDQAQLELSPLSKAYRGIVDEDYGTWGDFSDAAAVKEHELDLRYLAEMKAKFDRDALSAGDRLSYDLFENMVMRSEGAFNYAVAIARARRAPLNVLFVVSNRYPIGWRVRERVAQLADLRRRVSEAGVQMTLTAQHGNPAKVILEHAASSAGSPGLIVLGAPCDLVGLMAMLRPCATTRLKPMMVS